MRDVAAGRVLLSCTLALSLALQLAGGGRAVAGELLGDVRSDLGIGVTDNARGTPPPLRDEIAIAGAGARLRYHGNRIDHGLGYQIAGRWYLEGHGSSGFSHSAAWQTTAILSETLTLDLGASAGYARASVFDTVDPRFYMPNLRPLGDNTLVNVAANQSLTYQPTPRRSYSQSLAASRVHVLDSVFPLPETTLIALGLRGAQTLARDQYNADLMVTYMKSDYEPPPRGPPDREWLTLQLLGGWRRDLNPRWSAEGRVGSVAVFLLDGVRGVIAPAFQLNVSYQSTPWFLSVMITQTATPNPYYATTTLSDAVIARAALPLTRSERYYFTGFGSYVYGRSAREFGQLNHVFDAFRAGATLTARSEKLPFWAGLEYVFVDQRFVGGFGPTDHLQRQQLMLTVGGALTFGKGEPSPFRGLL